MAYGLQFKFAIAQILISEFMMTYRLSRFFVLIDLLSCCERIARLKNAVFSFQVLPCLMDVFMGQCDRYECLLRSIFCFFDLSVVHHIARLRWNRTNRFLIFPSITIDTMSSCSFDDVQLIGRSLFVFRCA